MTDWQSRRTAELLSMSRPRFEAQAAKRERALQLRQGDPELSVREIAERVGAGQKTVERWLKKGRQP